MASVHFCIFFLVLVFCFLFFVCLFVCFLQLAKRDVIAILRSILSALRYSTSPRAISENSFTILMQYYWNIFNYCVCDSQEADIESQGTHTHYCSLIFNSINRLLLLW